MNKAFRFRLYPNKEQQTMIAKTFGCCRFIFNNMLADKIAHYEKTKKSLKTMPSQYKYDHPWLREVDSLALCNEQLHLESAFRSFFRAGGSGFPKFKSKRSCKNSYTTNLVNGNIALEGGCLKLPKIGKVKVRQHRSIPDNYRLKSVTVSLSPSGKYHASLLYEYSLDIEPVAVEGIIGLDFSMSGLYVADSGDTPKYPRPYRQAQTRLAKEQRKLSRMKKGGKNHEKQRQKAARLHEHIKNQRKDFLHKQSRQITNAFDAVCIEDLDMKCMARALNFGKSVSDNGWGMFRFILGYKLYEQGKHLIIVDKFFPSSKKCSSCGSVKDELALSERTYTCDECGFLCDRDTNAATNIKNEGIRILETFDLYRGTHGNSLVNILPIGRTSQEAPASIALRH